MSKRTEQVASNLQRLIAEIISRELEFPSEVLVTVSKVSVAPDLKNATVYVSILPFDKSVETLGHLARRKKDIQRELTKHLTMRNTPKLFFKIDERTEYASEIDRIIEEENREE